MTPFVFITFVVFIGTTYSADLHCDLGEEEDNCPADCEVDFCPKTENYKRSCEKPSKCPAPACKCRFNYSRAINGTCISTKDCPAFPCTRLNEEYISCPPYCPTDDCSQATPDGRCPAFGTFLIIRECRPVCRCKKGYWRKNGICVPYRECPNRGEDTKVGVLPFWHFIR